MTDYSTKSMSELMSKWLRYELQRMDDEAPRLTLGEHGDREAVLRELDRRCPRRTLFPRDWT